MDWKKPIRNLLMPRLVELGREKDAEKLFKQFEDDRMASWVYSQALLDFRKHGDSPNEWGHQTLNT